MELNNPSNNIKTAKFIEVVPNKIILIKVTDQKFYEGRLTLMNITNNFVVYRFFNSQHMTFTISPIVYFIRPLESLVVNIKRFEKASDSEKAKMTLVAMESENKMTDINDAKNFIKKEDLYSTNAQVLNLDVELDNGTNSANYYRNLQERKTIVKCYNEQLNINSLTEVEEVSKYISEVRQDIEKYTTQISELNHTLKDSSANALVRKRNIYIDKNKLEEKMKEDDLFNQKSFPLFIVAFLCCLGLFVGKILTHVL